MRIDQIVEAQQRQLSRLILKKGVREMAKLYDETRVDIEKRLAGLMRRGEGKTFTAQHLRIVLTQVNAGIVEFSKKMNQSLVQQGRMVGTMSQKQVISAVKKMENRFTGMTPVLQVEQAAVTMGIVKKATPALLNRYKKSEKFYTIPVVKQIRMALAKSLVSGDTLDQAVDKVAATDGVFADNRWRAERIARTELAYTAGVIKQGTMDEIVKRDMPDLQKKLIATFDDRTGDDSKELHGQTQPIDQPFVWVEKDANGVPTGKVVKYMQPPNRPNDREISIPWRDSWQETNLTSPV